MVLRVVNDNDIGVYILITVWTLFNGVIRCTNAAKHLLISLNICILQHLFSQYLCIYFITLPHLVSRFHGIVICHNLFLSACDGIMMLQDTKPIKHVMFDFEELWNELVLDNLITKELLRSSHICCEITCLLFLGGPRGEEASPILIWHIAVRKAIIILDIELQVFSLHSIKKLTWCRVHKCYVFVIVLINELYDFVHLIKV